MTHLLALYQTFLDRVERAIYFIAMTLLAVMFANTATGIIVDQVVGNSLVWIEEINNLLFAWICFLGAGAVARSGGHIGVDIVYNLLGCRFQQALRVMYAVLTMIIVWVMVFFGMKMANFVGQSQTSIYLDINLFYFYLSVPVGGVLLGLNAIGAALPDPRDATIDSETAGDASW